MRPNPSVRLAEQTGLDVPLLNSDAAALSVRDRGDVPRLVVVGASAGGIEALSILVSSLPPDFMCPVVIAQHLDPTKASHLAAILSRHTALPVHTVVETQTLSAGIFVVPANQNVLVTDGVLSVQPGVSEGPWPSIDRLFTSAAKAYGPDLIAVILTGTGSDGTVGAQMAHKAGGTVIVQNPDTAAFAGMPGSLPSATADIVAELGDIGGVLAGLTADGGNVQDRSRSDLSVLLAHVRRRTGIDFGQYRTPTLLRRLTRRMTATGSSTLEEYSAYLQAHPGEEEDLVSCFLIKVTSFFRDPKTYRQLEKSALPAIIEAARVTGSEPRVWSAGCATGEEAYSLAIMFREFLDRTGGGPPPRVFATDLDRAAVAFARRGIYPETGLRRMNPELVDRYFEPLDGAWRARQELREMIVFGHHDVTRQPPFPDADLVVCRNLLIYLTMPLQKRVLESFAFAVRQGGFLVLGTGESAGTVPDLFESYEGRSRIFRRTAVRPPLPSGALPSRSVKPVHGPPRAPLDVSLPPASERQTVTPPSLEAALFSRLPFGLVVVDRQYDVQFLNAAARNMLGVYGAAFGQDLVRVSDSDAAGPLRDVIGGALRGEPATPVETSTMTGLDLAEKRYLRLTCFPLQEDDLGQPLEVVLLVEDVTAATLRGLAEQPADGSTQPSEIGDLRASMAALLAVNRRLMQGNVELAHADELNREAVARGQLVADDAQTSSEELETYSEELQATTEELETLNEQLRTAVEELNLSNLDLEVRAQEVMAQREVHQLARRELELILGTIGEGLLVVGPDGQTILANAAYQDVCGKPDSPVELLDSSGEMLGEADSPLGRATRGESFSMEVTAEAMDGSRRWFEVDGRPEASRDFQDRRCVVVFHEVTDRRLMAVQERLGAQAAHELRTPLAVVHGCLQVIVRNIEGQSNAENLLPTASTALRNSARMARLITDLVDVARIRGGKLVLSMAPTDAVSLVAEAAADAQLVAPTKTVRFHRNPDPVMVLVDRDRLRDVVLQLLTNAFRYAAESDRFDVRVRDEQDEAIIEVEDYGLGIDPGELSAIFLRSYQVDRPIGGHLGGLGLGLYIARQTIESHNGSLDVRSEVGKGSLFTVRLPIWHEDTASISTPHG